MFERLEISDYRSCLETQIDFQPDLSVLIGPNGTGKTNILNACLLLRSLTTEGDYYRIDTPDVTNESKLKAVFRYNNKKSILTAKIKLHTDENNSDVIVGSKQSWYAKDFTGNARRIKTPLSMAEHSGNVSKNFLLRRRHHFIEWSPQHTMPDPF